MLYKAIQGQNMDIYIYIYRAIYGAICVVKIQTANKCYIWLYGAKIQRKKYDIGHIMLYIELYRAKLWLYIRLYRAICFVKIQTVKKGCIGLYSANIRYTGLCRAKIWLNNLYRANNVMQGYIGQIRLYRAIQAYIFCPNGQKLLNRAIQSQHMA